MKHFVTLWWKVLNKYLLELKRQKTTHYSSTSTFYIMWDLFLCLYFLLLNSRLWVEEVTDYVKNIHWLDSCPKRVQFGRVLHGVKKGRKIGASIGNDSRHAHLDVFSITCRNVRETHASLYVSSAYSWSFCLNRCGFLPPPGYLWLQGQSVIMQAAEPYAVSVCIQ